MKVEFRKQVKRKIKKMIACGLVATCVLQCNGNIGTFINEPNVAYAAETVENGFKIVDGVLVEYTGSDTNIVIPNSVSSFGSKVFRGNTSIVSVEIPGTVKEIPTAAFHSCTSLEKVTIDEGVTSIGKTAFYGCSNLTKVIIPNSVQNIDKNAFPNEFADTIVIYGKSGSVAESFATENGFAFDDVSNVDNESDDAAKIIIGTAEPTVVIGSTNADTKTAISLIQTSLKSMKVVIPKNSNAKEYTVTCMNGKKQVKKITKLKKSSVTLTGLTAGVKYQVIVRATTKSGKKLSWTSLKKNFTLKKDFKIEITESTITDGLLYVSWNKVNGASKYIFSFANNEELVNAKTINVTGTAAVLSLTDLSGDLYYNVKIAGANDKVLAYESETKKITVDGDDKVVINDRFSFGNPGVQYCIDMNSEYYQIFKEKVKKESMGQLTRLRDECGYPSPVPRATVAPGCTPVPYAQGGHCFGMSCLTALTYAGRMSKTFLGSEKISQLKKPSLAGYDEHFYNVLNYYHDGQTFGLCGNERGNYNCSDETSNNKNLVETVKNSKYPVVFGFDIKEYVMEDGKMVSSRFGGHAINGLNVLSLDEAKEHVDTSWVNGRDGVVIECLDSNHPETEVYLFVSSDYKESFFLGNYDWEEMNPNAVKCCNRFWTYIKYAFTVEDSGKSFDSVNLESSMKNSASGLKSASLEETDVNEGMSLNTNYLNFRVECSDGTYAVVENGVKVEGTYEISEACYFNEINEEYKVEFTLACPKKGESITVIPVENQKSNLKDSERIDYTTTIGKNGENGYSNLLKSVAAVAMTVDYDGDVTTKSVSGEPTGQTLLVINADGTKMAENSECTIIQGSDTGITVEGQGGAVNVKTDNSANLSVAIDSERQNLEMGVVATSGAGITISGKDNTYSIKDDQGNELVSKDMGYAVCFVTGTNKNVEGLTHLEKGSKITEPTGLEKEGYVLEGWYTNRACTDEYKWNFETSTITEDVMLYANWVQKVKTVSKVKSVSVKVLKGKKAKITWKKCSDVAGYEIQISTNKNFKKANTTKKVISKNTYTKKLKKGTYYVRVRAYVLDDTGKKVYGKFSDKKKKSVK
ncbi:MAG: leucine-rich repeat protein [Lachnospiraceae bacterium]|nr:leucine-rich repeat protein [Lachnospiraceae bacterium]